MKTYSLIKKIWDGDPIQPGPDFESILESGLLFEVAEHKCHLLNKRNSSKISWYAIREEELEKTQ